MKVVWKYQLKQPRGQSVTMPLRAQPLAFQYQRGVPTMWALVDPEARPVERQFYIVATGYRGIDPRWVYVGTAQDPPYVWHLFAEP